MLCGCSMAWMPFTMSLASGDGDHGREEKDAADTWASMAQSSIFIVVAARRSVRWRVLARQTRRAQCRQTEWAGLHAGRLASPDFGRKYERFADAASQR